MPRREKNYRPRSLDAQRRQAIASYCGSVGAAARSGKVLSEKELEKLQSTLKKRIADIEKGERKALVVTKRPIR